MHCVLEKICDEKSSCLSDWCGGGEEELEVGEVTRMGDTVDSTITPETRYEPQSVARTL